MAGVLIMKILNADESFKTNMIQFRPDQNYADAATVMAALIAEHHGGCTGTYAVLADSADLEGKDTDLDVDIVDGAVVIS